MLKCTGVTQWTLLLTKLTALQADCHVTEECNLQFHGFKREEAALMVLDYSNSFFCRGGIELVKQYSA